MKYVGSSEKLIELNYQVNALKTYYYKVIHSGLEFTAVFIDNQTKEIIFDGGNRFKHSLLKELGEEVEDIKNAPSFMGGTSKYKIQTNSATLYLKDIDEIKNYIEYLEHQNQKQKEMLNILKKHMFHQRNIIIQLGIINRRCERERILKKYKSG